jgi:CubicO group peptidase (beta-lactamase class C family)
MRHALGIAIGFTLTLCAASPAAAPPRAGDPKVSPAVNALLAPLRDKHKLPALAAAVVSSRGLIAAGAVGVRKHGDDRPATVHDQFHLGSNTKAMTATLIAALVEEGKLSYDDTLGKAFPKVKAMDAGLRKVTLAQLLTHRAGLRANAAGGLSVLFRVGSTRAQRQRLLESIAEAKLDHEPGKELHYSNLGYVLAGHLAEEAAGATWEELIHARLFGPLGMKSAGFGPMGTRGKVEQPWQHTSRGSPVGPGPLSDNPPVIGPAGRVHCSVPDWAKFVADQLRGARGGKALLKPATYKKLHTSPYTRQFYTLGGWGGREKDERAGGLVLMHDGSNTMNYSSAWLAPERDLAVLVACNQGGPAAQKACHEARDLLIRGFSGGR